jgi:hypothetical protein
MVKEGALLYNTQTALRFSFKLEISSIISSLNLVEGSDLRKKRSEPFLRFVLSSLSSLSSRLSVSQSLRPSVTKKPASSQALSPRMQMSPDELHPPIWNTTHWQYSGLLPPGKPVSFLWQQGCPAGQTSSTPHRP